MWGFDWGGRWKGSVRYDIGVWGLAIELHMTGMV